VAAATRAALAGRAGRFAGDTQNVGVNVTDPARQEPVIGSKVDEGVILLAAR
jgi:hypothetical protein